MTVTEGGAAFLGGGGQYNNNFVLSGLGWNETTQGQLGAIRSDSNNTLAGTGNTTLINGVIGESVAGANLDIGRWLPAGGAAAAATFVINSGTTGDVGSFSSVVFGKTNSNAETASTATLEFRRNDNVTFTEPVNGASANVVGSLLHSGLGVLTWNNGASGYTGTTTVSGFNGKLVFGSGGAYTFAGTGNVALSNGADLEFNTSSSLEIGGGAKPAAQVLAGAAGTYLIQSGSGTITLGGTADNAGGRVQVNSGTVVLGKTSRARFTRSAVALTSA